MKKRLCAPRHARRRGTTLVELLVALPLVISLATIAAMLLVRLGHTVRGQSSAVATARELRQVAQVLSTELEPLAARHVTIVRDTMLQFREQLGVLVLCAAPDVRSIVVAAPPGSSDRWVGGVRPGDTVRLWAASTPALAPIAQDRALAMVPQPLPAGGCGTDAELARRWRLILIDSLVQTAAGTPVSVHRDARYRLYFASGQWWIGRQARDAAAWETIQPVAGPFRAPAAGGVSLTARDAFGHPLSIEDQSPDSVRGRLAMIEVLLTMNRRSSARSARSVESVTVVVPLRADAFWRH
jgi:type II secretory pathway pseudopilin PulG